MVVRAICAVSMGLGLLTGSVGGFFIAWMVGYFIALGVATYLACSPFMGSGEERVEPMVVLSVALEEGLL